MSDHLKTHDIGELCTFTAGTFNLSPRGKTTAGFFPAQHGGTGRFSQPWSAIYPSRKKVLVITAGSLNILDKAHLLSKPFCQSLKRASNLYEIVLSLVSSLHLRRCRDSGGHDRHQLKLFLLGRRQFAEARVDGVEQLCVVHLPELGVWSSQLLVHRSPRRRVQRLVLGSTSNHAQNQR